MTNFLIALSKATTDQIRRADPDKMAAKYGISPIYCRQYMDYELMMRGGRTNNNNKEGQLKLL